MYGMADILSFSVLALFTTNLSVFLLKITGKATVADQEDWPYKLYSTVSTVFYFEYNSQYSIIKFVSGDRSHFTCIKYNNNSTIHDVREQQKSRWTNWTRRPSSYRQRKSSKAIVQKLQQ